MDVSDITRLPPRESRVGTPAPAIPGAVPGRGDGPVVVTFLTSACTGCQPLWAASWDGLDGGRAVIVTPSPTLEDRAAIEALRPAAVPVVMDGDLWFAYGASGSPWFAVVRDGRIAAEGTPASVGDLLAAAASA